VEGKREEEEEGEEKGTERVIPLLLFPTSSPGMYRYLFLQFVV